MWESVEERDSVGVSGREDSVGVSGPWWCIAQW